MLFQVKFKIATTFAHVGRGEMLEQATSALYNLGVANAKWNITIHTEGLVNPKILDSLVSAGKRFQGFLRPLLVVMTPYSPLYFVDPLNRQSRAMVRRTEPRQSDLLSFRNCLDTLNEYYDIGYHGHFYRSTGSGFVRTFAEEYVRIQFMEEYSFLSDVGYRPKVYGGGWWLIDRYLVRLLRDLQFDADATLTDVGIDSFGRPQPIKGIGLGIPFFVADNVIEIQSFRSSRSLFRNFLTRGQGTVMLRPTHDYNISESRIERWSWKAFCALLSANSSNLAPVPELIELARQLIRNRNQGSHNTSFETDSLNMAERKKGGRL